MIPASLVNALATADHMDALSTEAQPNLDEFILGMFAYQPPWLTFLYKIRVVLLGLLGHKTQMPQQKRLTQLPKQPGEKATFFTVEDAHSTFWMANASEDHLTARIAVIQQAGKKQRFQYRVVTVVHFHNWVGRIYFAIIQPFHFLVVRAMMRHGA